MDAHDVTMLIREFDWRVSHYIVPPDEEGAGYWVDEYGGYVPEDVWTRLLTWYPDWMQDAYQVWQNGYMSLDDVAAMVAGGRSLPIEEMWGDYEEGDFACDGCYYTEF